MSVFFRQITDLIQEPLDYKNESLEVHIRFNENFVGFDGHFPGKPVLPGVVMIKVMTRMYELHKKKSFRVLQIKKAKFIEPVLVDMATCFIVSAKESSDQIVLQGKVLKSEKIIAKISLILQEEYTKGEK